MPLNYNAPTAPIWYPNAELGEYRIPPFQRFTPLSLFQNGEQGVFYDPSDLTTLYQDAAGTTPVTAAGDPVGLMLDKSQGLELGDELVTNGAFDTNINGWTNFDPTRGTIDWNNGRLRITAAASGGEYRVLFYQAITCVVGKRYKVNANIYQVGPITSRLFVGSIAGNSAGGSNGLVGDGKAQVIFTATATTMYIQGQLVSNSPNLVAEFDNITSKELKGNHAYQTASAARPLLGRVPVTGRRNLLPTTDLGNAYYTKQQVTLTENTTSEADEFVITNTVEESTIAGGFSVSALLIGNFSLNRFVSAKFKKGELNYGFIARSNAGGASVSSTALIVDLRDGSIFDPPRSDVFTDASATISTDGFVRLSVRSINPNVGSFYFGFLSDPNTLDVSLRENLGLVGLDLGTISSIQVEDNELTAPQKVVSDLDVTEAGVRDAWYLQGDGVDDHMLCDSVIPSVGGSIVSAFDAQNDGLIYGSFTSSSRWYIGANTIDEIGGGWSDLSRTTLRGGVKTAVAVNSLVGLNTNASIYQNSEELVSATSISAPSHSLQNYLLANNISGSAGLYAQSKIFGIVALNKALSNSERIKTEQWLANKAGVTL